MLTRSMCLCVVEEEWERERGVQSLITFSLLLLDCVQTPHQCHHPQRMGLVLYHQRSPVAGIGQVKAIEFQ